MERKRIIIDGCETDYVAYDNGTIFDERSRCFVEVLYSSPGNNRAYSVPRVELWFRGNQNLYVLKDLIASLFIENPYPDHKPNVGYISDDISDNSVNNLFYIPPCIELKKIADPEFAAEYERKQELKEEQRILKEQRAEVRAKRRAELELIRQERARKQEEQRKRIEERVPLVCKLLIEGYNDNEINNRVAIPTSIITAIRYQGAYPEIATQYGITPDNPPLPSPPYYVFRICEMLLDRFSVNKIAIELGISKEIIKNIKYHGAWSHIRKLYGIKYTPPEGYELWHNNDTLKQQIIELYSENIELGSKEIADMFGIPMSKEFARWCVTIRHGLRQKLNGYKKRNRI